MGASRRERIRLQDEPNLLRSISTIKTSAAITASAPTTTTRSATAAAVLTLFSPAICSWPTVV